MGSSWQSFFPQAEWDNMSNTQVQNAVCCNMAIALSPLTALKYVKFQNAPLLCSAQLYCISWTILSTFVLLSVQQKAVRLQTLYWPS